MPNGKIISKIPEQKYNHFLSFLFSETLSAWPQLASIWIGCHNCIGFPYNLI